MSPRVVDEKMLAAREREMAECALGIIEREGVSGLTIDKMTKLLPYSKGTIYNHFTCKEDVVLEVCNRSMVLVAEFLERAAAFDGNTREKVIAAKVGYLLYAKLYPTQFMLVITAKSGNVVEKASAQRMAEHLTAEGRIMSVQLNNIYGPAMENRDFDPPIPISLPQISFGVWSLSFGGIALMQDDVDACGIRNQLDSEQELVNNLNIYLDGLRWKPYTHKHDWQHTIHRIKTEIFAPEVQLLAQQQTTPQP